jgi:hypothetical protein
LLLTLASVFQLLKGPKMTVSSAAAASAAAQAYQATRATGHSAKTPATGAAFSAVANQSDLLPGISASGSSTLSSGMLSALLGLNSGSGATPTTAPTSASPNHRGIGTYRQNPATIT